ncbi:hypothetical protein ACKTEK_09640 [Tepidamorphus sp. 3E244]|uniref:hypothetical protein n=1 Tax=Tepidamorphus sp. 3E244 TaxID=3385498 RepID=UPI0038FCD4F3
MQYIEQLLGVELGLPGRFIIAFVTVMILIALSAALIRGFAGMRGNPGGSRKGRKTRLAVGEWIAVDDKRKLVLVRRDNVEHLLLIGGGADIVVESDTGSLKQQNTAPSPRPAPPPDVLEPPEEPRQPALDMTYRSPLRTPRQPESETAQPARMEPAAPAVAAPAAPVAAAPAFAPSITPADEPAASSEGDAGIDDVAERAIAEALDFSPAVKAQPSQSPQASTAPRTPMAGGGAPARKPFAPFKRRKETDDGLEDALMKELGSGN